MGAAIFECRLAMREHVLALSPAQGPYIGFSDMKHVAVSRSINARAHNVPILGLSWPGSQKMRVRVDLVTYRLQI